MSKYSCSEEYFEDYGVSEGFCFEKADEIVAYIRDQKLRAMSNDIPDELLSWWQFDHLPEPEELDRMEEVEKHRRLMCRWLIFGQMIESTRLIHLLLTHYDLTDGDVDLLWDRHTFLTRYILLARRDGRPVPDFDLMEVDRLQEWVDKLGGYEVLEGVSDIE